MNDEQEQFLRELVGPVGKFFEVVYLSIFGGGIKLCDLHTPVTLRLLFGFAAGSKRPCQKRCLGESRGSHHGGPEGDGCLWVASAIRPGRSWPLQHTSRHTGQAGCMSS